MKHANYFNYGKAEMDYLKAKDPVLGAIIDQLGHLERVVIPDMFMALINAIIGQQISTKAQTTIWNRMQEQCSPLTPEHLSTLSAEDLQSCGITMRKALYIKEITAMVLDGRLDFAQLETMTDDQVSQELSQIKGIGVWTAEMLMIFSMQRMNIISWHDLAILRGLRLLYHHRKITPALFAKYKRRYAPYATVASLYLWAIAGGACPEMVDYAPKNLSHEKADAKIQRKRLSKE